MLLFNTDSARHGVPRENAEIGGIRALTEDEISFVSGGNGFIDAIACLAAVAAAFEAPTPANVALAASSCMNAVSDIPSPPAASANCATGNACVDASVDGTDGNGSVSSGSADGGDTGGADD